MLVCLSVSALKLWVKTCTTFLKSDDYNQRRSMDDLIQELHVHIEHHSMRPCRTLQAKHANVQSSSVTILLCSEGKSKPDFYVADTESDSLAFHLTSLCNNCHIKGGGQSPFLSAHRNFQIQGQIFRHIGYIFPLLSTT